MENRNCENCAHAHPFGGWYDNRCDVWECEYIDRQEAIEAYKAKKDRIILRCNTFMLKEDFEKIKKEWEAQDPALLVIPCSMEVEHTEGVRGKWVISPFTGNWYCSICGNEPYHSNLNNMNYCPNCGARMEGTK